MKRGELAPELPYVPLFEQLRSHTRTTAITYGAIAAFQAAGHHPTVKEIAYAARIGSYKYCERAIAELVRANWLRRRHVGSPRSRVRYDLLGPTLRSANDNARQP